MSTSAVDAPPLPVGFAESGVAALQAEDAALEGGLKFRRQKGWAHDSILNWKTDGDSVAWNLDVLRSGRYAITLMYGCGPEGVGETIQVHCGDKCIEAAIPRAHDPMPPEKEAHQRTTVWTAGPVSCMTWVPLEMGPVKLEKGPVRLVVRGVGLAENTLFELKEARVQHVQ